MPIITKPSPLEKAATGIFSLDKTALALHPTVVASAHFSSPNVWDKIILKYKSETLGQFESVEFDASQSSPEGQFFVSATAEDVFEVEKITIIDKDGAILLIPRADLTVAEFDIDFNAEPPAEGNYILWNNTSTGYLVEADGGATTTASRPSGSPIDQIYATQDGWQTGDFSIEYEVSQNSTSYCYFGMYDTNLNPAYTTGFIGSQIYFLQSPIGSFTKPSGDTYRLKIERIGFSVKFYVNDVLAINATQTEANYDQIKVPFFSIQPNVYIVKTTFDIDFGAVANPIDYITWDLLSGYQADSLTITPTSGVSGGISLSGNDVAVKSDVDKATGDFDYTFKFDWSTATSVVHMFAGVAANNQTSGYFYDRLTCIYGNGDNPDTAYFWHDGAAIGTQYTQTLLSGVNTYRLTRVGAIMTHYLNGVQIYSGAPSTLFTAYPSVRTMGNSVVTESYITP